MLRSYLQLPRAVHLLCLGTLINRAGTFLIPFLTLYLQKELGFGEQFATWAIGLYGLGAIIGQLWGGHLADHIGRKAVMLLSLSASGVLVTMFGFVHSRTGILLVIGLLSIIAEMYRPAVSAMLGDLVGPRQRGHAYGLMYVAINLGFTIGPIVGGAMAKRSYSMLFWADGITSIVYAILIALTIRETLARLRRPGEIDGANHDDGRHDAQVPVGEAIRRILADHTFLLYSLAVLLVVIVYMQSMSTFPLYLQRLGWDAETYGRLIAINGILIVSLQLPATALTNRFRRQHVMIVATIIVGIGFALTGAATTIPMMALTVAVWTLGEIMQSPYFPAITADLAPRDMRGRYMGVFGVAHSLAMFIGAPLGGEVLAHLGQRYLWNGCMGVAILSAMIFYKLRHRIAATSHSPAGAMSASLITSPGTASALDIDPPIPR